MRQNASLELWCSLSKAESVRLVPELECKVKHLYDAVQNQDQLLFLSLTESEHLGFLLGGGRGRRLCEKKMSEDIAFVEMSVVELKVSKMQLDVALTTFDKIGQIGIS